MPAKGECRRQILAIAVLRLDSTPAKCGKSKDDTVSGVCTDTMNLAIGGKS